MKKYDVIVIGGGVAGLSLSVALANKHSDKSILLIREEEKGLVPCGLPYIFNKLKQNVDNNVKPHQAFIKAGGHFLVDTVISIDKSLKTIKTETKELEYDKLIFATGSIPLIPKFIKGYNSKNAFYVKKNYAYMHELVKKVQASKRIAIIGGGFIGLEMADEIAVDKNKKVTLIEMQKHCLSFAFSKDFSVKAEKVVEDKGVTIMTSTKLEELIDGDNGTRLIFSDKKELEVDIVIFSLGYVPETTIAKNAGLELNNFGAIKVDSFMQTLDSSICAIGDCAHKRDYLTGKESNAMLASVAGAESRLLAENLFVITALRNCFGTIRIFSTSINGNVFSSAGVTETEAVSKNIKVFSVEFNGKDRHPAKLEDTSDVTVKLTIMKGSYHIIGAEISGGISVGEMINVIGIAIQAKLNIYNFYNFQIGTHPLLTGGPTVYPLIKAVELAIRKADKE